ncbi:hypothetical protein [Treponema sp.]|uniref:hypothetical protein n=1 Tax=Treponema sp. TaxID=166 RepID=UPI00298E3E3F|nr:hypothetical protein [Treponema sp.]MCR5613927.1 hypothetical protein [Treponema sp.]
MKKLFAVLFISISMLSTIYAQSTSTEPVPYKEDEFPQWLRDVRDTEIIILGSMPFVTLGVTLTYSFINLAQHNFDGAYFINPFTKEGSFSQEQQIGIIVTSSIICVGIGITNLTINLIKRGIEKKRSAQILGPNINITTIDNTLNVAPLPSKYNREKKYLYGNIESAVF